MTYASFVAMQIVISTPFDFNSSCAVIKLGKCDFEQPCAYRYENVHIIVSAVTLSKHQDM